MWKSLFLSADILVIEGSKHYAETGVIYAYHFIFRLF